MEESSRVLPFGRIAPNFLCGLGALSYAKENNFEVSEEEDFLRTEESIGKWKSNVSILQSLQLGHKLQQIHKEENVGLRHDTVGVVVMDEEGIVVATSSGGELFALLPNNLFLSKTEKKRDSAEERRQSFFFKPNWERILL